MNFAPGLMLSLPLKAALPITLDGAAAAATMSLAGSLLMSEAAGDSVGPAGTGRVTAAMLAAVDVVADGVLAAGSLFGAAAS